MQTIDKLIDDIIRREGGYVNHPDDKGGPTNWGITQATLAEWRGRGVTAAEVGDLDREEAAQIYRKQYFEDGGIALLPVDLQAQAFDINVNGGLDACMSRFTGFFGASPQEIVDFLGPKTANIMLAASRAEYYRRITNARPANKAFLLGWLNRMAEFTEW